MLTTILDLPFPTVALVLQGGGALGAYQAGVYEALEEARLRPNWVAGISIGAINAAILAGNAPENRVQKLRQFWEEITAWTDLPSPPLSCERLVFNRLSAAFTALDGLPGFFTPRFPPAWTRLPGSEGATSFYDSSPLKATLESLVDFDRINAGEVRLSLGAVNVRTGNSVSFDNWRQPIGPEHVMASGALPPGLPPIRIDEELYWDGGLVSNTPLSQILDEPLSDNTLIFQVDLFSARGPLPRDLFDVAEREKDIRFSSRTRLNTDHYHQKHQLKRAIRDILAALPPDLQHSRRMQEIEALAKDFPAVIVHLIYRRKNYETESKDYEFSRSSMREHWRAGYQDTLRTIERLEWRSLPPDEQGLAIFDLVEQPEETAKGEKSHESVASEGACIFHAADEPGLSTRPISVRRPRVPHHHLSDRPRGARGGRARTTAD